MSQSRAVCHHIVTRKNGVDVLTWEGVKDKIIFSFRMFGTDFRALCCGEHKLRWANPTDHGGDEFEWTGGDGRLV